MQLDLLIMVESILDEGTVAVGTGMDFWESLRRSNDGCSEFIV